MRVCLVTLLCLAVAATLLWPGAEAKASKSHGKGGKAPSQHKHKAHSHKTPKQEKKSEEMVLEVVEKEEPRKEKAEVKEEGKEEKVESATPTGSGEEKMLRLSKSELAEMVAAAVQSELAAFRVENAAVKAAKAAAKEEQARARVAKVGKPMKAKKCLDVEWEGLLEPVVDEATGLPTRESRPLQRCSCSCLPYPKLDNEKTAEQGEAGKEEENTLGDAVDDLVAKAKEEMGKPSHPDPIDEI